MKLAFASPLNPVQSGISDYSEELLPWLSAWATIDLFVDGIRPSNPTLAAYPRVDLRRLPAVASAYDAIIYQMGNSPCHAGIYQAALRTPGVVVLHEHVLHHLIAWMSWDRGDARSYLREFRACYGADGERLARRIITGQEHVDFFQYPLSDRLIRAARGLIVHSDYVRRAVLRVRPDAPVFIAPMGVPLPAESSAASTAARARLGIAPDALVIGSFGHMNPYKRLDTALRAFRALRQTRRDALYVLVGSVSPNYDIKQTIALLGLSDSAHVVGYADRQRFEDYVAATDICINLRYPSAGETSASVLRLMGAGLPVLVSRTATFEELPDGACIKVDADENEKELLVGYLRLLAARPDLRRRIGASARRYVATEHTLERAANAYLQALRAIYPALAATPTPTYPPSLRQPAAQQTPHPVTDSAQPSPTAAAAGEERPQDRALDIVAEAAGELGLAEAPGGLDDAARAWAELTR